MISDETLRILIPIITFIGGIIFTLLNTRNQRKLSNRCYPSITEAYFPFDLSKINIDSGTKMYYCGDYADLFNSDDVDKTSKIIYVKLANLGPGHMLNCNIDVKISTTDFSEEWDMNLCVNLIRKDELILIPTVKESMLDKEIILKSIVIEYLTAFGEKMKYTYWVNNIEKDKTIIKDTLQIIKYKWFKKKVYSFKGKSSLFVFINLKKDN
ncbi:MULTISPECIES: hypothetical protein [Lysinibacillus]|uniref:Uncharacterized protein n=1 Tax=Lysinibacillus irui TaxID=2998077 RepID=A0AAJ5URQ5_9BACI|nr:MULTISPECIES: hypothetical protein [Lysinibacillus]WDV05053.1 hypothetical protein OU989_12070 [Lysinibacillus irui]